MAQTVFFSVECNTYVGSILKKLDDDSDFVWGKNKQIPERIHQNPQS